MKQLYHHWEKWEDYMGGFYSSVALRNKEEISKKILELFESRYLTGKYMVSVCDKWTISCEQNLTNQNMNRVAWLGQAACCLYCGASCFLTMNIWNKLKLNDRMESDKIATIIIKEWEQKKKLETILKNGKNEDIKMEYQTKLQLN